MVLREIAGFTDHYINYAPVDLLIDRCTTFKVERFKKEKMRDQRSRAPDEDGENKPEAESPGESDESQKGTDLEMAVDDEDGHNISMRVIYAPIKSIRLLSLSHKPRARHIALHIFTEMARY